MGACALDVAPAGWAWGLSSQVPSDPEAVTGAHSRTHRGACTSPSTLPIPLRGRRPQAPPSACAHRRPGGRQGRFLGLPGVCSRAPTASPTPRQPDPDSPVGAGTGGGSSCQFCSRCRWPDRKSRPGLASPRTRKLAAVPVTEVTEQESVKGSEAPPVAQHHLRGQDKKRGSGNPAAKAVPPPHTVPRLPPLDDVCHL